jgi:hypothetical protein
VLVAVRLLHLQSIVTALSRRARGGVDYLVVRAPSGEPIAKGGVDYETPAAQGSSGSSRRMRVYGASVSARG